MIDHELISIQGVIGRVFQIGRTRIFCLFTLLHVVNARIYVERRTKKRPEFQIGIKLSTHFMSFFFFFFFDLSCVYFACVADALIYLLYQKKISQMALLFHLYFLVGPGSGYRYDSKAFLFSLVIKPGWAPVKLSQSGQYSFRKSYSIFITSSFGPTFGGGPDINIGNYQLKGDYYSDLGYTYSPPSGYSYRSTFAKTFLAGTYKFTPGEVETFYETT